MVTADKIKILHISQAGGGVKTYIESIVTNNPNNDRYQHFLITSKEYLLLEPPLFKEQYTLTSFIRSPSVVRDVQALYQISRIARSIKPDLIHCHSAKGGLHGRLLGALLRIPTIFTPNAFSFLGFEGLKFKGYKLIEVLTRFKAYILAVSGSEFKRAIEEVGYNPQKTFVVSNFTNVSKDINRSYNLRNRVGMIGRLSFQKNPLLFLDLARQVSLELPDVKFILLGAGYHDHLVKEVNAYILENNLNEVVEIKSWSSYPNIMDFYDSIDVFLLTSKFEGLSLSLLESMSLGIPVVTTHVDGNKDLVDTQAVISNDVQVLKNALVNLLTDKEMRIDMGNKEHARVFSHHNRANALDIYAVYSHVLQRSK
jgi:glycosyltransferase involved in cell wall biosynthesis